MKKLFFLLCICLSGKAMAFDTWWHAECTRKAMVANGFSGDARLATQVSNYITDFMAVLNMPNEKFEKAGFKSIRFRSDDSYDYLHFDAVLNNAGIEQNWRQLFNNTVAALKKYSTTSEVEEGFRQIVLINILGCSLHTIQDFYSHSNWVNLHTKMQVSPIPIWYDVAYEERKKLDLFTGVYKPPFNGHASHEELNKDNSSKKLNKESVEAAERASIDWIRRIMEAAPEVPWAGLKAYNIQNNMVMKNFLVTQDASFLTSSSIFPLHHLDGEHPARKIFDQEDESKDYAKAGIVVTTILETYAANIQVPKNKMGLPTPYWAGFMGYNISHMIAGGLMLNTKKYPGGTTEDYSKEPHLDISKDRSTTAPSDKNHEQTGSPSSSAKGNSKNNSGPNKSPGQNGASSSTGSNPSGNKNPGSKPPVTPPANPPGNNQNTGGIRKDTIPARHN